MLLVLLPALPAYAGVFASITGFLWDMIASISEDIGLPMTLLGVAWTVLAFLGRVGGLATAIPTVMAGIVLMNLEALGRALLRR
jgi:hypothetical protein